MDFVMNELSQAGPVLFIKTGNVVSVDVGELGFSHLNPGPDTQMQRGLGVILRHSNTPSPPFEHEHDFEAPCEGGAYYA